MFYIPGVRHIAVAGEGDRAATESAGGHLDILVNNAATLLMPTPTADIPEQLLRDAFAVNVFAPFLWTGVVAPGMARNGKGPVRGRRLGGGVDRSFLSAGPLVGKQLVRAHPVAVVVRDRRDDQLVGPGGVAQPLQLVGYLGGGSHELGVDPIRDEFAVGIGPGVGARFVQSGKRNRAFSGADAAHPEAVTRGEVASGGFILGDDDVGRDRDVGPVKLG
jgi:hypothetical protein